jgi:hypothetical protein
MPAIQGRTREQLRQHIGYALGGMYASSATSSGSTTTLVDNSIVLGGADTQIGKWVRFTSGDNDSLTRRVTDSAISSNVTTLTFMPAVGTSTASESYELWDGYNPDSIDNFINQAILGATGWVYDPIENIELHGDGHQTRFDIPSNISMISKIEYRHKVKSTRIHATTAAFDEHSTLVATTLNGAITDTAATSVPVTSATELRADQQIMVGSEKMTISSISSNTLTVSRGAGSTTAATHSDGASVLLFPVVDTEDKKQGTASNKFIIPAAAGTNQIVTESITSKDLSKYDTIELWVKITGISSATTAGNLQLLLDDTASCASPLETKDIPSISPDTWTFVRLTLDNPETDTAIISIGLKQVADLAACTIWIDDIVAVANDTAEWTTLDRRNWKIDKESRSLVLMRDGQCAIGYSLIKIVGGDKPALLTSDATETEIDEDYIIASAVSLALLSTSGGPGTDPDAKRQLSTYWASQAERARRAFPMLVNVRSVD